MLLQARGKRVLYVPGDGFGTLNMEFVDGRTAAMTHFEAGAPFMAHVCMEGGNQALNVQSDFWAVFIQVLVDFFRTGKEPVPHQETLNVIALREAGMKAVEKPFEWVALP